jgi:2,4-dienoyl-CoA reductase-like NADH-dependent reductase (Old Yellow Enzyme family)
MVGKDDDLVVGLQLTHSGRWSYRKPLIAVRSPLVDKITYLDKKKGIKIPEDYPVLTDDYLERLEDLYVEAAKRAHRIGFQFVDVKQCHTYLLNELLGARTREGNYGGSWENRTRFVRNVIQKIQNEVGHDLVIASRINVHDGIPYHLNPETGAGEPLPFQAPYHDGFGNDAQNPLKEDLTEPKMLVGLLQSLGVKMVNVSMGSPYFNPHVGRPFEKPPSDGYESPEHPLVGVDRHFRLTAEIQQAFPDIVVIGTGYSWLQIYLINAAETNLRRKRATIVAIGRGALAYPDFAKDAIEEGHLTGKKVCLAVSYCTSLMRAKGNELGQFPAGCVPRDSLYAPIYKETLKKK